MPDFSLSNRPWSGPGHINLRTCWKAHDPQHGAGEGAEPGGKGTCLPQENYGNDEGEPQAILNLKRSHCEIRSLPAGEKKAERKKEREERHRHT